MDIVFQFGPVFKRMDLIIDGVTMTIQVALLSTFLGFLIGIICARIRIEGSKKAKFVVACYVEFIRNTPFLVQLFMFAYGLPQFVALLGFNIRPSPYYLAIIALSINLGAYSTEIIRAGLEAIPKSQIEAAQGLALTPFQIFSRISLPPAIAKVYPALSSQFILHMLGTSVISTISVQELTLSAGRIQSETFRAFESYFIVTAIYFALAIAFRIIFKLAARFALPWLHKTTNRS